MTLTLTVSVSSFSLFDKMWRSKEATREFLIFHVLSWGLSMPGPGAHYLHHTLASLQFCVVHVCVLHVCEMSHVCVLHVRMEPKHV